MADEMDKPSPSLTRIPSDPSCMAEVLAYVDDLRSSSDGWQRCLDSLTNGEIRDDRLKFIGLQTIEHYLRACYCSATQNQQEVLRQFLSRWIQANASAPEESNAVFVRNKAAQVFALTFICDFPRRWPTFITDLIDTLNLGPMAVDHFIRVLSAINVEIADREMPYTEIQIQRNNMLKNAMRESCVKQIVGAVYDILNTYDINYPLTVSHALETLAIYVHWIDIGLVANEQFVDTLLRLLISPRIRDSVVIFIQSMVVKGMDPLEKFSLVESLICVLSNLGVFVRSPDDDSDFCTKLSCLINNVGLALLDSYNKIKNNGPPEKIPELENAIDAKVPIMVTFIGNDFNEVSNAVLEFAKDYVHFLKGKRTLSDQQKNNIQEILVRVIHKMKYDVSYRFDSDGEDEVEFQIFRKQLKVVFDNLVELNKDLVLTYVLELANHNIRDWRNTPFADVEVTLNAIYLVGEVLPQHAGQFSPMDHIKIYTLLEIIMDSGVNAYPHTAVALQYFEIMVRYERLLLSEPQKTLSIISIFMGTCGLRHSNSKLRSRAAYLFCKFMKGCKSVVQAVTKEILVTLQELLAIQWHAGESSGSIEDWASQDDELFLFEAAGLLIVSSSLPDMEKVSVIKSLLEPIISKFDSLMKEFAQESDEERVEILVDSMCHMMSITTRISKAFSSQTSMKSIGCVPVYSECLDMFLSSLEIPAHNHELVLGVRQFMHRMVVCMDTDILPYIPRASQGLLKNNDLKSMQEYIPLLVQVITKFKRDILPFLQECMTPIVTAIFNTLMMPLEDGDEDGKVEKIALRKLYFQFISVVITNAVEVFLAQQTLVKNEILLSLVEGADDVNDPVMQKQCFYVLKKLCEFSGEQPVGDDFIQFMHQTIITLCFEVTMKTVRAESTPHSDTILGHCATCLKTIYNKKGEEMIAYVETTCLVNPHIPPKRREEFALALKSDAKTLKNFLMVLCQPNS